MTSDNMHLNLPTDIPDWPPSKLTPEAWLKEQRQVLAEHLSREDADAQLQQFRLMHECIEPFVWRD